MSKTQAKGGLPQMTEEQKKQAIARAFAQKKLSIAEGCLFNLCQNTNAVNDYTAEEMARFAVKVADEFMKAAYEKPLDE